MKIKIGNSIYDSEIEPIMIIMKNDEERELIINHLSKMHKTDGIRKYVIFPDLYKEEDIREFMKL